MLRALQGIILSPLHELPYVIHNRPRKKGFCPILLWRPGSRESKLPTQGSTSCKWPESDWKPESDPLTVRVRKSRTVMLSAFPVAGQKWHSCSRGAFAPAAGTSQLKWEAFHCRQYNKTCWPFFPLSQSNPKGREQCDYSVWKISQASQLINSNAAPTPLVTVQIRLVHQA